MKSKRLYFQHDHNARNDVKILELRAEFGVEGYGVYFMIIESLFEDNGFLDRGAIGGLSLGYGVPKDKLKDIIDFCIKTELFDTSEHDSRLIFSSRVNSQLDFRKLLSTKGLEGANKRWGNDGKMGGLSGGQCGANAKVKEKEKEKGKGKGKGKEELKIPKKTDSKQVSQDLPDEPHLPDSDLLKLQKLRGHEYFKNPRFKELWEDFCRSRGQKYTIIAKKNALMKLFRYDLDICITSIENSVSNGYLGLFPEKVNLDKNKPKQQQFLTASEKTALACDEVLRREKERIARGEDDNDFFRDIKITEPKLLNG